MKNPIIENVLEIGVNLAIATLVISTALKAAF